MQKLIILFLFLFAGDYIANAQNNCACSAFTQQQFDEVLNANDSLMLYQTIRTLNQNNNKNCSVTAQSLEIAYLLNQKKLTEALEIIQQQEKYISGLTCKDEMLIQLNLNYAKYCRIAQDYEGLSKYAFKALELAEAKNDKVSQLMAIAYIVHLFTRQGQYEKN
jgi:hypothetical protein